MSHEISCRNLTLPAPHGPPAPVPSGPSEHRVQFYSSEPFLCEAVCGFVSEGLRAGQAAVLIASGSHLDGILAGFAGCGVDAAAARADGRLRILDSDQLVEQLVVDGTCQADLFRRHIASLFLEGRDGVRASRAYCEMVDRLWREGRRQAALRIEELWNELAARCSLSLLCGYASEGFDGEGLGSLHDHLCAAHTHVEPSEGLARLSREAQLREIARLEHQSRLLAAEIERRKTLERILRDSLAERRKVVAALRDTQVELHDFLENAVEGLHRLAPDGTIEWANNAELAMLGYVRGEYVGRNMAEFHADPEVWADLWARLGRNETVRHYEVGLRAKDGSIRTALVDASARFERGRMVHVRGFVRDVSDRRRADELLRQRADELRIVANAIPSLVAMFDRDSRYRFANGTFERWFGIDPEALIGRHPREVFGARVQAVLAPHVERVVRGEELHVELRVPYANGARDVDVHLVPLVEADGEVSGWASVITDVTDARRGELERAALLDRERAANRAKDEFLAMLGHELRNPLSPILTALQLLRNHPTGDGSRERDIIERQVRHVVCLVDDLLDVSRITREKVELARRPVELARVVTAAIETTSPLLEERRHQLGVSLPKEPVWVEGDVRRLEQIVTNLLTNAAKYTEPCGRVEVRVAREGADAVLTIRDDGIGIPRELLPKLFDLFVQGERSIDRSQGGLGLGLAIVRSLVAMHGGTVSARSDGVGTGSEFCVRLPVHLPDGGVPEAEPSAPAAPLRVDSRRILVVDDNRDAAELLAELLESVGHEADVAFDGPSALSQAVSFQPEVALLDIGLPVMDGYEVAARLRALPGMDGIRLVALTGYGQRSDEERSTRSGLHAHLVKPADLEQIERTIERLFTR